MWRGEAASRRRRRRRRAAMKENPPKPKKPKEILKEATRPLSKQKLREHPCHRCAGEEDQKKKIRISFPFSLYCTVMREMRGIQESVACALRTRRRKERRKEDCKHRQQHLFLPLLWQEATKPFLRCIIGSHSNNGGDAKVESVAKAESEQKYNLKQRSKVSDFLELRVCK